MIEKRYGLVFAVAALAIAVVIAGCGGSSSSSEQDSALIGIWVPVSVTANGDVQSPGEFFDWEDDAVRIEYEFKTNGIVVQRDYDAAGVVIEQDQISYTASNEQVFLTLDDETNSFNYSISGNVLTASFVEDGESIEMIWVRKANLTTLDSNLVKTWKLIELAVNGHDIDAAQDFVFNPPSPGVEFIAITFKSNGTFLAQEIDNGSAVLQSEDSMQWATGGGAILLVDGSDNLRGYYAVNIDGTLSITILSPEGATVQLLMEPWGEPGEHNPALVTTWQYVSGTVDGTEQPLADILGWPAEIESLAMDFHADGTLFMGAFDSAGDILGTLLNAWKTDGDSLYMRLHDEADFSWEIVGNVLSITWEMHGGEIELVFTK